MLNYLDIDCLLLPRQLNRRRSGTNLPGARKNLSHTALARPISRPITTFTTPQTSAASSQRQTTSLLRALLQPIPLSASALLTAQTPNT